jgi:glucosamine-phosphate N-acetyltransferase
MNDRREFEFRELEESDYYKGYFELLSQLTVAPKPSYTDWVERLKEISSSELYKILVIENLEKELIVGTITVVIELKFIRGLGKIGHIEDFVIDIDHRKKRFGAEMTQRAIDYCKKVKCYKVILDSKDEVRGFYEKMGFSVNGHNMVVYFK